MTLTAVRALSVASVTAPRYTGKERDAESGNDYMFARYYNSATGRFLSPDWSAKEEPVPYAKLDNPQTLNLYAYVGNNPITNRDADGHVCIFGIGNTCNTGSPPPPAAPRPPSPQQVAGATPSASAAPPPAPLPTTASVPERISLGVEAAANTVVGVPKAIGGAAGLIVGTLGSEIGVGAAEAVKGGYDLLQGAGQITSALYQGRAAITGNTTGVDDAVDKIAVSTSLAGATATLLNGGDYHAGAKWAAAEGVFSDSFGHGALNQLDKILNEKELVTK